MPGPTKTPTPILKLRGSWRAKTRKGEPAAPKGVPSAPKGLDAGANEEWERIIPMLAGMRVLSPADMRVIAAYCRQASKYDALEAELTKWKPGSVEHRRISICSDAACALMLRAAAKLGLSPADRAGIKVADDGDERTDKSRFFTA